MRCKCSAVKGLGEIMKRLMTNDIILTQYKKLTVIVVAPHPTDSQFEDSQREYWGI